MTDAQRTALLVSKGWTLGIREDGQHRVRDSSGSQIGVGPDADAAVAAAIAYGTPETPEPKGGKKS